MFKKLGAAFLTLILVTGCSSSGNPEDLIRNDLEKTFDQIKNKDGDWNEVVDALDEDEDFASLGLSGEKLAEAFFGDFDYKIHEVKADVDAKEATAVISFKVKDSDKYAELCNKKGEEYAKKHDMSELSEKEMNNAMGEVILEALRETPVVETEQYKVVYELEGKTWVITPSSQTVLDNAIFGL